ncbi:MAG TPA: MBG domain-containing protein [Stellaceae bacterium]|nr:MBG domain-containing protein [Stellaceae bacterium]
MAGNRIRPTVAGLLLLSVAAIGPTQAQSTLPTGGHVVAGGATIGAPSGTALSITQTSPRAVVNWNSFSVGRPNIVTFAQPSGSAAILNRVTGATPSSIAGQIDANGQVYLVNPNGIAITPTGNVQVGGGFVASTLGIANRDFMRGNLSFTGNGASAGVGNAGHIGVGDGGFAALIGGTAANSGTISVPLGRVALGSGEAATLDLNGDGFMQVAAPTGATTAKGQALVGNSGTIAAPGGTVELKAATVATAIRDAVNMSGTIAANSASGRDGAITLSGGPGGAVNVTGTLDASAPMSAGNGGAIAVAGARVRLGHHAILNASGAKGGTVLVGVSGPGGADEAATTTIADGATILARGLPGAGGHIETSGRQLDLGRALIDAGIGGSWLIDPSNLTIDATAATTIDNALNAGIDVTEQTTATVTAGTGIISTGAGDITVASALSWGTGATLTLSAYNNIVVSAPITVSGGGTLALTYNNAGANSAAALTFVMGQGSAQFTGGLAAGAHLSINGTSYNLIYSLGSGTGGMEAMGATGNYALAIPIDASMDSTVTLPLTTALVGSFSGNFNGLGNTVSNLTISGNSLCPGANCGGFFGFLNGTISNFGLIGGSVTDTATSAFVGALVGFNTGTVVNSYATAAVTGPNGSTGFVGGLVGANNFGVIETSYATGAVNGGSAGFAGGLVGRNSATIADSYATGSVTASGLTGGLIGGNEGSVSNSFATGTVSGPVGNTGGFIGENDGSLANTFWDTSSSGTATGIGSNGGTDTPTGLTTLQLSAALPGGFSPTIWGNLNNRVTPYLGANPGPVIMGNEGGSSPPLNYLIFTVPQLQAIGANATALSQHYILAQDIDATGVTGFTPIGTFTGVFNGFGNVIANLTISENVNTPVGLFTLSTGTIENLGLVGGSVTQLAPSQLAGGLVGQNNGTILSSYSTAAVIANNYDTGGLVGQNEGTITDAYATGAVTVSGSGTVGGLVGLNNGMITDAYATGAVTASASGTVGGLVGWNAGPGEGTIVNAYAAGAVTVGSGGHAGGLIGLNSGSVTNGYWNSDRTAAGLPGVGGGSSSGVFGLGVATDASAFVAKAYTGFNFISTPGLIGNNWVMVETDGSLATNASTAIAGTMPMLAFEAQSTIQNAHQLQLMTMNAAGNYTLGRSIDATATGSSTSASTGTDVWGSTGFVPINGVSGFTGTFSGLSSIGDVNTITNLTINSALPNAGLFASIGVSGTVHDVGLVNVAVSDSTEAAGVGGLAGGNSGTIFNTYTSGTISNGDGGFDGGLVGGNGGAISTSFSSATIVNCSGCDAGGLVGKNSGSITDAYTTGIALVGLNQGPVTDAYALGPTAPFPGLIISSSGGTVIDGYYDAGTTGAPLGPLGDNSVGLTTAQLQSLNLSTGFQNPGKWGIVAGKTYPYLCFLVGNCGETPQAVSGTVYTNAAGTTPAGGGVAVTGLVNGATLNSAETGGNVVNTGADGYYYYLLGPNAIPANGNVLTYAGATAGAALADQVNGAATNLAIYANTLHDVTPSALYSTVQAHLATAEGIDAGAISAVNGVSNLWIDAANSFTIDGFIVTGTLTLNGGGTIGETASGRITAATLTGSSAGDTVLNGPSNFVDNLAAFSTTTGGANGNFTLVLVGNNAFTIVGAVNAGTGTVSLTNPGFLPSSITEQTGGSIAAGTLIGSAGGSAFFQQPGNQIANLGPFTETAGANFALTDARALDVSGSVNAGVGFISLTTTGAGSNLTLSNNLTANGKTVALNAAGTITQPAGIITAATLTGGSVGGATFDQNNAAATFGAWSDTGTGSAGVSFLDAQSLATTGTVSSASGPVALTTTAGNLTLNGNLTAAGNTVTLNSAGTITQPSGFITAATLVGSSVGGASLTGANLVDTLGLVESLIGFTNSGSGNISFTDAKSLTIGSTVTSAGDVTLTVSGNISDAESGSIRAVNLVATTLLEGGGAISLISPSPNSITGNVTLTSLTGNGGALAAGAISLADDFTYTVASLGGLQTGIGTTGTANLDSGVAIGEASGAIITASTLTGFSFSEASLTGINQVGVLGPFSSGVINGGGFSFTNGAPLTTTSTISSASNLTLTTTGSGSNLTLGGSLIATGNAVTLNSAGTIAQPSGSITAATLTGSAVGGANFSGANLVNTFGNFTNTGGGAVAFTDGQALTTATITSGAGGVTLTTTGNGDNLTLAGNITTPGGTITLNSAGTVFQQSGFFTASTVTGSSVGGASMASGNNVSNLGPWSDTGTSPGGILFNNGLVLTTAGTIASTGPVTLFTIGDPDLILNSDISGTNVKLSVTGNINQTAGGITATNFQATTELLAGGSITLNSATNAITGNVTLTSFDAAGTGLAGGAIGFSDSTGFTIAGLGGVQTGIATNAAVTAIAGGDMTIAPGAAVTGAGVALSTLGNFVNNSGAGAVAATGGDRWLIYSNAPAGDTFGNLDSGNTAVWGATFATLPPIGVTAGGNRYLFAQGQPLTVTTTNVSKTFGQDATAAVGAAFTETGFAPGVAGAFLADTAANVVSGTPNVTSTGSPISATVAGNPYPIVAAAGSLTVESGYSLAFVNAGFLTVNPAALTLTVTASDQSKVYGQALSLGTTAFTTSGLINSDTVAGVTLTSPGAAATANVADSPYVITASNAVGSGLSNYTITYVNGALTVTPAALTVTASSQSKIYGQALSLGATALTTSGLVNGDTVTGATLTSPGAAATANVAGSPYMIAASNALGSGLSNYTITYANGALTVTPAALSASITGNPTKIYDGTAAAPLASGNFTLTGFVADDGATVSPVTGTYVSANAGTGIGVGASLVAGDFTPTGTTLLGNYTLPTTASGTGTITQAALTITADNLAKVYGNTLNFAGTEFGAGGLVAGDTVTGVSLASAGAAAAASVTGSPYAISPSAAIGTGLSNYAITYVPGGLTVTPRPLTVAADDLSRLPGQPNPPLTFAITSGNLVNGDSLSGALATTANTGSAAGSYPITQGTLAAVPNYALTFADGTLIVTATAVPAPAVPPNFGVSPDQFIPPVSDLGITLSGPTQCPPNDVAAMLQNSGSVVIFGTQATRCGNL